MEKNQQETPVLRILENMQIGEEHSFPARRMNSVKAMSSSFGFQWGKKFSTSINRKERTILVKRIE
ncbi:hypothetical protein OCV73_00240 [Barnesiella propionica]|uniref:hypothetical protein n=1 Tax=Barnesiella propionica TaxID=2981781 RepID=UPI0011CACDDF|nr:hypothetical protein [Barnesiella propionica]MCU6767390.1 hypothetical protein [Barnesiella propionica]